MLIVVNIYIERKTGYIASSYAVKKKRHPIKGIALTTMDGHLNPITFMVFLIPTLLSPE